MPRGGTARKGVARRARAPLHEAHGLLQARAHLEQVGAAHADTRQACADEVHEARPLHEQALRPADGSQLGEGGRSLSIIDHDHERRES